jgi:hypothetical protein
MSWTVAESQHCCMMVLEIAEDEELDGDVVLLVEGTTHQFMVMSMEGRVVGTDVGLQKDAEVEVMIGFDVVLFRLGISWCFLVLVEELMLCVRLGREMLEWKSRMFVENLLNRTERNQLRSSLRKVITRDVQFMRKERARPS